MKKLRTARRGTACRTAFCAIAVTAVIPSAGLADQNQPVTEKNHRVEPFEVLVTDLPATIELTVSDTHAVNIRAQKYVHTQLSVGVLDGRLQIRSSGSFQSNQPIEIRVTTQLLAGLEVGGAASILVDKLDTEKLEILGDGGAQVRINQLNLKRLIGDLQGASSMTLSGQAQDQQVRIDGSASYDGQRLVSRSGGFQVRGAANAVVNVTRDLRVEVSDAASVEYLGNPSVTEQVQGAGSLARR